MTKNTKVLVSGSFARAISALRNLKAQGSGTKPTVDGSWFDKGPPVRYDEYHLDTLKPYTERE